MSVLSNPTLVLNKNWHPIGVETVEESVKKLMKDACRYVDAETYEIYGEVDDPSVKGRWSELDPKPGQKVIKGTRRNYVAPEVVLLTGYDELPKNEVRLTRRNVLIRDKFKCQYCGLQVAKTTPGSKIRKLAEYTWDHVIPRSQGGKTTWTNIATACFKCNSRKADKSLERSGMKLMSSPKKPTWNLNMAKNASRRPASWDKFLKKDMLHDPELLAISN